MTDVMIGGKTAVVRGHDVGKGCVQKLRGGCPCHRHRDRPDQRCRPRRRASVLPLEDVVETADIFVTATGNADIIRSTT